MFLEMGSEKAYRKRVSEMALSRGARKGVIKKGGRERRYRNGVGKGALERGRDRLSKGGRDHFSIFTAPQNFGERGSEGRFEKASAKAL